MNSFIEKRFILILLVSTIIFSGVYYFIHGRGSAVFVGALVFAGGYLYRKISIQNSN